MDHKQAYLSKPWLKYYPKDVPHEIDVPDTSVPDIFDQMADKFKNKVALIFYGKKIKYGELKELTNRFASALVDLGVAKGDTVALYLLNCPQYVIAYIGALKVGAKVKPLSARFTPAKRSNTSSKTATPGRLSVRTSCMTMWKNPASPWTM
jgi:long-chain acyl-CoA synthetase